MVYKTVFAILLSFSFSWAAYGQKTEQKKVLEDLEYLNNSLLQAHYDLYAYTPQKEFDENFASVKASITQDSLSSLEIISLFQRVISKANTGHGEIDFPIAAYMQYAQSGGTLFPLEIAMEGDQPLVRKNFSDEEGISIGAEIVAINQVPIQEILDQFYPQLSAETMYFKHAKLEFWTFPRLYWQVFGQVDEFQVSTKNAEGISTFKIQAIDLIEGYEMKRVDIITEARTLEFHKNAVYLNPGNFSGDEDAYKIYIDSAFQVINSSGQKNLILDLRNNTGGHDAFSDYLVSYIADKPFKWNSAFTLKTSAVLKAHTRLHNDTTDAYFQEILAHKDGAVYDFPFEPYEPQPSEKRFKGEVYVLINRHSYSMAAVTAAMIQDYGFAELVGENTGDFPTLHASQFSFTLPHTGVVVKIPKGYMVRPNGSEKREGVIPDLFIKDYLVDEQDEILEGILEKLTP